MAKKHARLTEEDIVYANNLSNIWSKKKIEFKNNGKKLTQEYAAEQMGFDTQGTISHYINGYTPLNDSAIYKFADLLDIDPSEIKPSLTSFVNKKSVAGYLTAKESQQDSFGSITDHKLVPVITWELAKEWKNNILLYNTNLKNSKLIYNPGEGGSFTYALRVNDDSMTSLIPKEKSFPRGCIIYVDMDKTPKEGDHVIAKILDTNQMTFKTYQLDAGKAWLMPKNHQFEKLEITDNLLICGVVVGKYESE